MNEKVKLPKRVAEAIDIFAQFSDSKAQLLMDIVSFGYESLGSKTILLHFNRDFDKLMEALVYGYESEETPEEKLSSYYNRLYFSTKDKYKEGTLHGIEETLNLLGIKIDCINGGDEE